MPMRCNWVWPSARRGSVPRPKAAENSAPRKAEPFAMARPNIMYSGPQGSSGVANPMSDALAMLPRPMALKRIRAMGFASSAGLGIQASSPSPTTAKAITSSQGRRTPVPCWNQASGALPSAPARAPTVAYADSLAPWYSAVSRMNVQSLPRATAQEHASGPHMPRQCRLVTRPAMNAAAVVSIVCMSFGRIHDHGNDLRLVLHGQAEHHRPGAEHDPEGDKDPDPGPLGKKAGCGCRDLFPGLARAAAAVFATAAVRAIFGGTCWRRGSHDFWIWGLGRRTQWAWSSRCCRWRSRSPGPPSSRVWCRKTGAG